jgi:XTP/dITP diphosphohydrolase
LAEPEEAGMTFAENARIKAMAAATAVRLPALADDSGLVVEALDGAPGIHSARWAGPDHNFHRAMETIEQELQARGATTPERRRAHFISALCLAWPDGHTEEFEARVAGALVWPPRGDRGFGYDPMFLPDGQQRTFGEMSSEEKHGLPPLIIRFPARSPAATMTDRHSGSTSIGRSACRNVLIAISIATFAANKSMRHAGFAPLPRRLPVWRRAFRGAEYRRFFSAAARRH